MPTRMPTYKILILHTFPILFLVRPVGISKDKLHKKDERIFLTCPPAILPYEIRRAIDYSLRM